MKVRLLYSSQINFDTDIWLDLFARDAGKPSFVDVSAKAYRRVTLRDPGDYKATLTYYNGSTTVANWHVRDLTEVRRTKNVLLFIGDGMTTNMITVGIQPII